jgi:hypothetical protein
MRLDVGQPAQELEEADAVDGARGSADPDHDALHSLSLRL